MPATIAIPLGIAALGAASKYGAATSGAKAQREAAAAQERSTTQALEYQKTRDSRTDSVEDRKWSMYQAYVQDYIRRHGGDPSALGGGASGAPAIQNLVGRGGGAPASIADLVGSQQPAAGAQDAPPGSIAANVGGWNDWQRYGA